MKDERMTITFDLPELNLVELNLAIQDYLIYNKQCEDDLIAIADILDIDVKQFEEKL